MMEFRGIIMMGFQQSTLSTRATPCKIQCEGCSGVRRSATKTCPTPIAFFLFWVTYTGVLKYSTQFSLHYLILNTYPKIIPNPIHNMHSSQKDQSYQYLLSIDLPANGASIDIRATLEPLPNTLRMEYMLAPQLPHPFHPHQIVTDGANLLISVGQDVFGPFQGDILVQLGLLVFKHSLLELLELTTTISTFFASYEKIDQGKEEADCQQDQAKCDHELIALYLLIFLAKGLLQACLLLHALLLPIAALPFRINLPTTETRTGHLANIPIHEYDLLLSNEADAAVGHRYQRDHDDHIHEDCHHALLVDLDADLTACLPIVHHHLIQQERNRNGEQLFLFGGKSLWYDMFA